MSVQSRSYEAWTKQRVWSTLVFKCIMLMSVATLKNLLTDLTISREQCRQARYQYRSTCLIMTVRCSGDLQKSIHLLHMEKTHESGHILRFRESLLHLTYHSVHRVLGQHQSLPGISLLPMHSLLPKATQSSATLTILPMESNLWLNGEIHQTYCIDIAHHLRISLKKVVESMGWSWTTLFSTGRICFISSIKGLLTSSRYITTIHPTYPILWPSKSRTLSKLSSCPPMLRDAFNSSLYAAIPPSPVTNLSSPRQQATVKAAQLITAFQFESGSPPSLSNSLIHLQTLMLLAIRASQARTPGGLSQSVWLGSAVGLAYTLKLYQHKPLEHPGVEDLDSDDRLARKIWWALVIMDRWHASSTSSPVLIPDSSVVLFPDDQALLGDSLYQVARKCAIPIGETL